MLIYIYTFCLCCITIWPLCLLLSSSMWTRRAGWITHRQTCSSTLSTIRPTPSWMLKGVLFLDEIHMVILAHRELPYGLCSDVTLPVPWCFMFCRVIQMIDENKEQLRNLFRTYNVVDVQPAVTDKLPDDITTLQVCEAWISRRPQTDADVLCFCAFKHYFPLSQLVIIILAVLLCLAGILFVTMNWHYRRV